MAIQNSNNQEFINNSDGFSIGGGTAKRKVTVSGGDVEITGGDSRTINFTGNASLEGTNTGDETIDTIKTKLGAADTDSDGYLSSTDWNTFNGKQDAMGADDNYVTDAEKARIGSYPDLPAIASGDYLADDGTFRAIAIGSGGNNANTYLSNTDSATSGYKTISYIPDSSATLKTIVANNNTVQGEKYLFNSAVGVTTINAGNWIINFTRSVSSAAGTSTYSLRFFKYSTGGVETNLFTFTSKNIEDTSLTRLLEEVTVPILSCDTTDRIGFQVSFTTDHPADTTFSYYVGGANSAYVLSTLTIRHTQVRLPNEDAEVQHMTSSEKTAVGTIGNKVDKTTTVNGHALSSNVTVTASDVGLGNVDNTSDATKNSATATLTNKRNQKRVYSTTSNTSLTPEIDTYDIFIETALAGAITINNHSTSTPVNGEMILIDLLDNGTARAITWGNEYNGVSAALPSTTIANKRMLLLFKWNSSTSKNDLISLVKQT